NRPFMIEHVGGRPAADIPPGGDRAVSRPAVPPGTPGHVLLLHHLFEVVLGITVDAEQRERSALQSSHERPLVRVHGPAGSSPVAPEIDDHDFAPIIAQLETLAVTILAF